MQSQGQIHSAKCRRWMSARFRHYRSDPFTYLPRKELEFFELECPEIRRDMDTVQ